jgi:calcineurin-like phosphoesterase family protein
MFAFGRSPQSLLVMCVVVLLVGGACSRERRPAAVGPGSGFVVIGDFGSGDDAERAVASAIRRWVGERRFDALVTVGDNVYRDGASSAFADAWERPYGWVQDRGVRVVASLGNHDVHTDDGHALMGLFGMPGPWYREHIGPVDLFVLDANDFARLGQMRWLSKALTASTASWQVLVFHEPAYSCGKHGSKPGAQRQLLPAIAGRGVDLVLNGHDHDYQRFAPIDGVTYVVAGAGGAALYPVRDCPAGTPDPVASNDDEHSFLYVTADPEEITGTAVGEDGAVLDTFTIRH